VIITNLQADRDKILRSNWLFPSFYSLFIQRLWKTSYLWWSYMITKKDPL